MTETHWTIYDSPIGPLTLVAGSNGLTGLRFGAAPPPGATPSPMPEITDQLDAYFKGELREFDIRLDLHGTSLQRAVWNELLAIPYGETASYGEIAARIGHPGKARAVGRANGRNPIAIVCPCHRVIGSDGSLVGYGGGLENKRTLLDLEAGAFTLV